MTSQKEIVCDQEIKTELSPESTQKHDSHRGEKFVQNKSRINAEQCNAINIQVPRYKMITLTIELNRV